MKLFIKASNYAWDQIKVSFPNETRRLNKGREFCLVVAGAHKVGSTWIARMIRDMNVFRVFPVPPSYRSNPRNPGLIGLQKPGVSKYFESIKGFRLYKSHSEPPHWELGTKVKYITVIRDPRDVVVSNIFYLANLDPELGGWRELSDMATDERIRHYLKKGTFDLELLRNWSQYEHANKVYYERLLQAPQKYMEKIFKAINMDVSTNECNRIVRNNAFDKLSGGRKKGQENTSSFFRKGVAGDWKNHFGEREIECFKTESNGGWNKLLIELGYEDNENWQ